MRLLWTPILPILFAALPVISLDIIETNIHGSIAKIAHTLYFIQGYRVASFTTAVKSPPTPYGLITSVPVKEAVVTAQLLSDIIADYTAIDDVWSKPFLQSLILSADAPITNDIVIDSSAFDWMEGHGVQVLFVDGAFSARGGHVQIVSVTENLPAGPYAYSMESGTLAIHNVYRLYPDEYDAFMVGCIPDPSGHGWIPTKFTFPAVSDESQIQYLPVPSRLPHFSGFGTGSPFSTGPLAGKRVAIKDIFDMRGLPTSAGSLAYLEMTSGTTFETSVAVQKLITLGVVPIGKTRTSQFAHGASPWEFHDFSYSWNPRGDGFLTAVASSSGSACAIAGYDWLDLAVGSDTRGSVRKPASMVGVYGIRPSFGAISLEGVVPLSEHMDTVGIFARDPKLFVEVTNQWSACSTFSTWHHDSIRHRYQDSPVSLGDAFTQLPRRILFPKDHFPVKSAEAQLVYETFLEKMVNELNLAIDPINITEIVSPEFPNEQFPMFQASSNRLSEYHSWVKTGEPLMRWYKSQFGRDPYLDPMPRIMFARAMGHSEEDYHQAVAYKERFTTYMSSAFFGSSTKSCSESIFVYDAGTGGSPSYRVEDFNSLDGASEVTLVRPGKDAKLSENLHYLASMASLVDVTVPIGQASYFSPVTRRREVIPVTIQLVTRRGCDAVIMQLVRFLAEKGILKPVKTGSALL
ncbi:hypothetical protein VNI00_014628 [Paramarasmius palmivorus]|uniref:Amidase domain-containing protein n=1 Tax=Paramarasmius palmivorus TaxID=297713 RepID=A0AAW0BT36_9AGAR